MSHDGHEREGGSDGRDIGHALTVLATGEAGKELLTVGLNTGNLFKGDGLDDESGNMRSDITVSLVVRLLATVNKVVHDLDDVRRLVEIFSDSDEVLDTRALVLKNTIEAGESD